MKTDRLWLEEMQRVVQLAQDFPVQPDLWSTEDAKIAADRGLPQRLVAKTRRAVGIDRSPPPAHAPEVERIFQAGGIVPVAVVEAALPGRTQRKTFMRRLGAVYDGERHAWVAPTVDSPTEALVREIRADLATRPLPGEEVKARIPSAQVRMRVMKLAEATWVPSQGLWKRKKPS